MILAALTKRTMIYFDPDLHKALRLKSVETAHPVSEPVNNAVKETLAEDAEDLAAFDNRANEPLIGYSEMVKRLKQDGRTGSPFKRTFPLPKKIPYYF